MDAKQAEHFNQKGHRYDEHLLFNPPSHTRDEVGHILSFLKGKGIRDVVEFGSGNGRLTIPLLRAGIRVTAVDISCDSLLALSDIAMRMHIPKSHLSTSQTIPDKRNGAIVGCDILHHVPLGAYLDEMKGKLRDNGCIIFSEPNILNAFWPLFITFFIDWRIEWRIIYCNYFTVTHLARKYGFRNVRIRGLGLFPLPLFNAVPFLQRINYLLGNAPVLKLFAYRFVISADA